MQNGVWDGITLVKTLNDEEAAHRQHKAALAKANDWPALLTLLSQHPALVNVVRPGSQVLYSPLHFAAYGGAPVNVIEQLLEFGAWRTLRTVKGERAVDIAQRRGHHDIVPLLTPKEEINHLLPEILEAIQKHFHILIMRIAGHVIQEHNLRLPQLEPLLEVADRRMGFIVPGMAGGFFYNLDLIRNGALLHVENWSRFVSGSAEYHVISFEGSLLVSAAFDM